MMNTLPRRRDPVARLALLAMGALVAYLAVVQPQPEARAEAVIIVPTQALPTTAPTAAPAPTEAPTMQIQVVELAPPTPEPPPPQPQVIQQVIVQQEIVVATPTAAPAPEPPAAPGTAEFNQQVTDNYLSLPTLQLDNAPANFDDAARRVWGDSRKSTGR